MIPSRFPGCVKHAAAIRRVCSERSKSSEIGKAARRSARIQRPEDLDLNPGIADEGALLNNTSPLGRLCRNT